MDFLHLLHKLALEITIIILPLGGYLPWATKQCGDPYSWSYQTTNGGNPTIYVCQQEFRGMQWQEDAILYHEIGHYVWDKKLTDKEREIYTKQFDEAKAKFGSGSEAFYREYSYTDVKEDFSDNVSVIAAQRETQKTLWKRKEWILRERRIRLAKFYLSRIEKSYDSQNSK